MKKIFFIILFLSSLINGYSQTNKECFKNRNAKYKIKDYKGALDDFSKAIELNSINAEAFICRTLAKIALVQKSSALKDVNKAVELGNEV
jgi:tetratricopeptide (TPR) repeat protein